jgi:hypothetical protein
MKKNISKFTLFRLVLSGCVAGVALFGVVAPFFGIDTSTSRDLTAAAAGGGISAALIKAAHLI